MLVKTKKGTINAFKIFIENDYDTLKTTAIMIIGKDKCLHAKCRVPIEEVYEIEESED